METGVTRAVATLPRPDHKADDTSGYLPVLTPLCTPPALIKEVLASLTHVCPLLSCFFPPAVDMMDKVIAREKVPPHSLEYSSDRTAPQVKGVADDVKEMSITRYDLTLPG